VRSQINVLLKATTASQCKASPSPDDELETTGGRADERANEQRQAREHRKLSRRILEDFF
jgi:hypothetical protein